MTSQPLRVVYVEGAIGFGGSLVSLLELVRAFPPGAVAPTLLAYYDVRPFLAPADDFTIVRLPSELHPGSDVLPTPRLARYRALARRIALRTTHVREILRGSGAALVHANNSLFANLDAALAGRALRLPVLSHQRAFEPLEGLSRLTAHARAYSHHVAISRAVGENLRAVGVRPSRVSQIYDPVAPLAAVESHRGDRPFTFTIYSMLQPWKGQDVFLRAAAGVAAARPRARLRFVVAGRSPTGAEEYAAELRGVAAELGIADRTEFRGQVNDVAALMLETDVAVHASVDPEPFGRVIAEPMTAGVPVIATAGGGAAEIVADGLTGRLVPRGDVGEMSRAMIALLDDDDARAAMSSAGARHARTAFAPEASAAAVLALYRELTA